MLHLWTRLVALGIGLSLASTAAAEVADKTPTLASIWDALYIVWAVTFALAVWRWKSALPAWAFSVFLGWGLHAEANDTFVGPAILRELGQAYVDQAEYIAALHVLAPGLIIGLAGLIRRLIDQRLRETETSLG